MQEQEQVLELVLVLEEGQNPEAQSMEMARLVDIDQMNRASCAAGIAGKYFLRSYRTAISCDGIDRMGDDALSDKDVNSP